MSDAKLEAVKELIKEKRYEEARVILKTVKHPKVNEWLSRLDEMSPPQERITKKRRVGCFAQLLIVGFVLFGVFIVLTVFLFAPRGPTRQNQIPSQNEVATINTQQPTEIDIDDPYNTGIAEGFLADLKNQISEDGYISYYEAQINDEKRLIVYVEANLLASVARREVALNVIENILKLYAIQLEQNSFGEISVNVFWPRNGVTCGDGAGMGYVTMQSIPWENVSQEEIFKAIDKQIYADEMDNQHYSVAGWAPDLSGIGECNK